MDNGHVTSEPMKKWLDDIPSISTLTDRFGNTFHFGNAGKFWLPLFPIGANNDYKTHVEQIRDMEIRNDDILICSYPKTGLHWHLEIVKMLLDGSANMSNELEARQCFLDLKAVARYADVQSPRILFTHVPFRYIPRQALEKKIKIIYLNRNPKDTFVSFYNHCHGHVPPLHYPGTFEHFFYLLLEVGYMYGDLFQYLLEWQTAIESNPDVPIYTSMFEELKLNPVEGVKKLNAHLGTGRCDDLCAEIAEACSFQKMKSHKEANAPEIASALFKGNKVAFYRKGDVGDWKNWFTVTMNEFFDKEYSKRMAEYKTIYKYSL